MKKQNLVNEKDIKQRRCWDKVTVTATEAVKWKNKEYQCRLTIMWTELQFSGQFCQSKQETMFNTSHRYHQHQQVKRHTKCQMKSQHWQPGRLRMFNHLSLTHFTHTVLTVFFVAYMIIRRVYLKCLGTVLSVCQWY